jgi:hypothetical protein
MATGGGTASGGGSGGGIANDVTGTRINHFVLAAGNPLDVPADLSAVPVTAAVEEADGGFSLYPGTGTDAGTFSISGVPNGSFYLRVGGLVTFGSTRTFDLGQLELGRPNPAVAMTANTTLRMTASGLAPWGDNDDLQLFSANAGLGYFSTYSGYGPILANAPTAGATTLANTDLDFDQWGFPLIDQTQGDDITVCQLSSGVTDAGVLYQYATRGARFAPAPFSMADGAPTTFFLTLVNLAQTAQAYDVRFPSFASLRPDVNTAATASAGTLWVDVNIGPLSRGQFSGTPDVLIVSLPPNTPAQTFNFAYGNPFPASSFPEWGGVNENFDLQYSIPSADGGTTNPRPETATIESRFPVAALTAQPLQPVISPPRSVTLEGLNAFGALGTISATPVVQWAAPLTGTASYYSIEIIRLFQSPVNNNTRRQPIAIVYVPASTTRVRLPPGLLTSGSYYYLRIGASLSAGGYNPASPALPDTTPSGFAPAMTSSFRAQ